MVTWKERFGGLIREINGLEDPEVVRRRELEKILMEQIVEQIRETANHFIGKTEGVTIEDIQDAYEKIDSQEIKPNTLLMSRALCDSIFEEQK